MNNQISDKDKKDWENFLSKKEKLPDKDNTYSKNKVLKTLEIDLHGLSLDEANKTVEKLIKDSFNNGITKIRIVTGKGLHSDNEKELGDKINICSISFGASRDFIFKSKKSKLKKNLNLQNGSALYMMHPTQKNYNHSLPKRTKVVHERVNLTFRYIQ